MRRAGVDEKLGAGKSRGEDDGETRRWLRGRLINFFAFFDPHKLCRYTTTEGSLRALKGSASFRTSETGKGAREGGGPAPYMYSYNIYVYNIYTVNEKKEQARACFTRSLIMNCLDL